MATTAKRSRHATTRTERAENRKALRKRLRKVEKQANEVCNIEFVSSAELLSVLASMGVISHEYDWLDDERWTLSEGGEK